MADRPWYAEFFGEDYLRLYRPYLHPRRTEQEVMGILRLLDLPPGSKILDLACGPGRHSIPLAALGYQVTGLDLSDALLDRARAAADDVGVDVRWIQSDMRQIPFESEFDAVINIFTAFGYLESDREDLVVLQQVRQALAAGGRFLLETVGRDAFLRHFQPYDVLRYEDGLVGVQEQSFDPRTGRMGVRVSMFEPDGSRKEYRYSQRMYTLTELADMLEDAGLRPEASFGGLDESELTVDSPRLVVLARKP